MGDRRSRSALRSRDSPSRMTAVDRGDRDDQRRRGGPRRGRTDSAEALHSCRTPTTHSMPPRRRPRLRRRLAAGGIETGRRRPPADRQGDVDLAGRFGAARVRASPCLISSPVSWSTTFIDRRTLPRSSKPRSLTQTLSPSLTTSVILATRPRGRAARCGRGRPWRRRSSRRRRSRRSSRPCPGRSCRPPAPAAIDLIQLSAAVIALPSAEATLTVPSS